MHARWRCWSTSTGRAPEAISRVTSLIDLLSSVNAVGRGVALVNWQLANTKPWLAEVLRTHMNGPLANPLKSQFWKNAGPRPQMKSFVPSTWQSVA